MTIAYKKDGSYDTVQRIQDTLATVKAGKRLELFERIKIEVSTLADVIAVSDRRDFVRFCCGGHPTIHSLIADRKAAGRTDWYA